MSKLNSVASLNHGLLTPLSRASPSRAPAALDTAEEAVSLLRLLRADHEVSLAELRLLDCEIDRNTARAQYFTQQAEKAKKRVERAEHAIGHARMVISRSGYLYEATVRC